MNPKYQMTLVGIDVKAQEIRCKIVIAERATREEMDALNAKMLAQKATPIEQCIPEVKFVKQVQAAIQDNVTHEVAFMLERLLIIT